MKKWTQRELRAGGVRYYDLTDAFVDVAETLYLDGCCHLNETGNRLLARRVTRALVEELQPARASWVHPESAPSLGARTPASRRPPLE